MTQQLDFHIVKQSNIGITTFARLAGVSRLTVYRWTDGYSPSPDRKDKIRDLLGRIQAAVDRGDLPIRRGRATQEDYIGLVKQALGLPS